MSEISAEMIAAIAAAVVLIIGAMAKGSMSIVDKIAALNKRLTHETSPNHGTSLKDALNRLEETTTNIESAQRGMMKDIGRLADADVEMQHNKSAEHERLWKAVDRNSALIERYNNEREYRNNEREYRNNP